MLGLYSRHKWLRGRGTKIFSKEYLIICVLLLQVLFATLSFAGDAGRYQVVYGNEDNAYLVDSQTGFVWILTYRTMPTGREPVAIPYKFIGITPQNQTNFLLENAPGYPESPRGEKRRTD
jgi:hypothetical protein